LGDFSGFALLDPGRDSDKHVQLVRVALGVPGLFGQRRLYRIVGQTAAVAFKLAICSQ
jgi:hypothetical protein